MKFGAIIVAAGLSSRMNAFKPMLELADSTVIKTAVKTLNLANIHPIFVVTGYESSKLEKHLSHTSITFIHNPQFATTDMFYSAKLGMSAIKEQCDAFFFLPADTPLFSLRTIESMKMHMVENHCDVVSPSYEGKGGHPLLIRNASISQLISYMGNNGLRGALKQFDGIKSRLELSDLGTTLDADYPEDYEKLQQYARLHICQKPLSYNAQLHLSRETSFWSPQLSQLLQLTHENHSMRQSCSLLGISYNNGWRMIKIAEHQLGFPLLISQKGGKTGGGSYLTPKGKAFLNAYLKFEKEVSQAAKISFEKHFHPFSSELI